MKIRANRCRTIRGAAEPDLKAALALVVVLMVVVSDWLIYGGRASDAEKLRCESAFLMITLITTSGVCNKLMVKHGRGTFFHNRGARARIFPIK